MRCSRTQPCSMLVAEEDGELLGFSALRRRAATPMPTVEVGEVRSLFVAAGRWRRGVGRALMAAALDDLRERGYPRGHRLVVRRQRARQRASTSAQGFTRDGAERTEDVWAHILEVRYRRSL